MSASVLPRVYGLATLVVLSLVILPRATAQRVRQARVASETIPIPIVEGRDIRFSRLSATPGLSQARVGQIAQDDLGFMWFGTQYGLNRFDGNRFKVFTPDRARPSSLGGVYIYSMFKDRSGALWIGSDQYLDRFDPATETFKHYSLDSGTAQITVNHISQDHAGMMWLATGQGLYRLDPSTGRITRYSHDPNDPASLSSNDIKSTGEDRAGTLWVATRNGLDAFDRGTGKITRHVPLYELREISFHEDRTGLFWIIYASGNGLAAFDRATNTLTRYSFADGEPIGPPDPGFYSLLEDRDGTMWFGTGGAGLLKYDREKRRFIRYHNDPYDPESLSADRVTDLFEDREGNIWAALHGSAPNVFARRRPPFAKLPRSPRDPDRQGETLVNGIFEDHAGILWVSTGGVFDGVDRKTGQRTEYGPHRERFTADVLAMIEDRSGGFWVGTVGRGLSRYDRRTGRVETFRHDPGNSSSVSSDLVEDLLIDHTGTLWAATSDGLDRFDSATRRFTTYKVDPKGKGQSYLDLVEDRRGAIWLGSHYSGLHRFDPSTGRFTLYAHTRGDAQSLSDNRVNSVYVARSGQLWAGTQNGLDAFHPETGTFTVYDEANGLAGNVVSCILEDATGNLWMSTNRGISRFDPRRRSFANYSAADGLPGADLTGWGACAKSPSGEMFFGGFSGATAFFPEMVVSHAYAPPVVLTDFRVSGAPVDIGAGSPLAKSITYTDAVTLSSEQNMFAVEFSALSYLHPPARYRYMLEGLDHRWNDVGSDGRLASYTTLPAGTYTFHAQSGTNRGRWREPGVSLRIEILPSWWQTWWFRSSGSLALLGLAFAAYRFRIASIKERERNFRKLAENAPDMIARFDHNLRYRYSNPMMEAFTGLSSSSLLGRTNAEMGTACENIRAWDAHLRQAISTGRPVVREDSFITSTGQRHLESRFVPEHTGNGTTRSVLAITRDITERRQAEEELRRSEAYLAEAQRLSRTGSWAFDVLRQEYVHWSPALSRIWGFDPDSPDMPTVDAVKERCHPKDRAESFEAGRIAMRDKTGYDIEHRLLLPDGSIRHVQSTAKVICDGSGEVVEILGTSIDITERKRSERALRRARSRGLELRYMAMMKERTRLARELHDTLLQGFNGVVLRLMAASKRVETPSEASAALDRVLDLAQATLGDARRSVWDLRAPSLNGEFPTALQSAAQDALRETGVTLAYRIDGTPRPLDATSESVMARVMLEAIANTVKHAHARVLRVRVSFRSRGVRLSVRDDGRGFHVSQDFDSYGEHWGLLGMRERARQVGATLDVRSGPGEGTEVVLVVGYAARHLLT